MRRDLVLRWLLQRNHLRCLRQPDGFGMRRERSELQCLLRSDAILRWLVQRDDAYLYVPDRTKLRNEDVLDRPGERSYPRMQFERRVRNGFPGLRYDFLLRWRNCELPDQG